MKCKLLFEREVYEPTAPPALRAQCVRRGKFLFAPAGTLIDDPNCHFIVGMGQAEPADEECATRCGLTPEEFALRVHAAKRLAAGIAPEDFGKFDAGEIAGYNADGSYKPGPNWNGDSQDEEEDE